MSYTAELIAVGTELLLGNIANTDAQMLSEGLSQLGINVYYHTVVGDNPQRVRQAVEIARQRADILITTGGLGPTCDDLTKVAVAQAFGKELVFHEETAQRIRELDDDVLLIFITNMAQYAIRGYAVDAMDYVLKLSLIHI